MKVDIVVPSAGESVTEATVAQVMVENGASVNEGDEVLELETDKVNQVIYAPASGAVTVTVKVDDVVKVGQVLGSIDSEGAPAKATPKKEEKASEPPPAAPPPAPSEEGIRKTPESFVADLKKPEPKAPAPEAAPAPVVKEETAENQTRKRMTGLRRTIAKRLVEVKTTTAMLTTFNEVDMSKVMDFRAREKDKFMKKHNVKLGFMSFFVKAAVQALKALPDVNAFIEGDEIVYNNSYHIGVAVSTDKGLMVPVIKDAEKLSFADIEKQISDYAKKAREGAISVDDMQGGTFTITNGGVFGSMLSTPILNPPQSAILGMHNIVKRAVVDDDKIVIRPIMYLALSYDHRIVDGKEGTTFLVHMKENLEDPERLLLDF